MLHSLASIREPIHAWCQFLKRNAWFWKNRSFFVNIGEGQVRAPQSKSLWDQKSSIQVDMPWSQQAELLCDQKFSIQVDTPLQRAEMLMWPYCRHVFIRQHVQCIVPIFYSGVDKISSKFSLSCSFSFASLYCPFLNLDLFLLIVVSLFPVVFECILQ